MFKRLQLKMSITYTLILIGILLATNISIYILMANYNKYQMSREVESMLGSINSSEWLYEEDVEITPETQTTPVITESPTKDDEETTTRQEKKEEDKKEEDKKLEDKKQEEQEDEDKEKEDGKAAPNPIAVNALTADEDTQPLAVLPTAEELIIPKVLDTFQYYLIFDLQGEIVREKADETHVYQHLKTKAMGLTQYGQPILIEVDTQLERYYLLAKMPIIIQGETLGYFAVAKDVSVAFDTMGNLVKILVLSSVVGTLVALALGYFLAGRSIAPIREAYDSKQTFLANASHELKTPLSVILLSTEALQQEGAGEGISDFYHQTLMDIEDEARKMNALVGHLMVLARSDSSKMISRMETLNFSDLALTAVAGFERIAAAKAMALETHIEPHLNFCGDPMLLISLMTILVDNAIKYTPENGLVEVSLKRVNIKKRENLVLRVRDTGIGIPKEAVDKIFDRFYRVESSRSKETGGYGLGLAIAKEIVDAHGATVAVSSIEGSGTEFTVTFSVK